MDALLLSKHELSQSEAIVIEEEYARDGWKTTREPVIFQERVLCEQLVLWCKDGSAWTKRRKWELDH